MFYRAFAITHPPLVWAKALMVQFLCSNWPSMKLATQKLSYSLIPGHSVASLCSHTHWWLWYLGCWCFFPIFLYFGVCGISCHFVRFFMPSMWFSFTEWFCFVFLLGICENPESMLSMPLSLSWNPLCKGAFFKEQYTFSSVWIHVTDSLQRKNSFPLFIFRLRKMLH